MIIIRPAIKSDAKTILGFITDLAEFENAKHEVLASENDIENLVLSESSTNYALIAEQNGVAIGFSIYFFNYSTWLGKNGLYLEDLYIAPLARGLGAGKLMLKSLAEIAIKNNCGRMDWQVLDWNKPAIDFYDNIGAKPLNEWLSYRLTGKELVDFAK